MKKLAPLLILIVLISGCASDEPPPKKFVDLPTGKIVLNVAKIDLIDHSQFQPANSPYNLFNLQPTVAQTVYSWLRNNVQAGGTAGTATIIIQDASLSSRAIATSDDPMDRIFKRQQNSELSGRISVQTEIRAGDNDGLTDAEATRSITLPEVPNDTERQNAYVGLLSGLNKDFHANFAAGLRQHTPWAVLSAPDSIR